MCIAWRGGERETPYHRNTQVFKNPQTPLLLLVCCSHLPKPALNCCILACLLKSLHQTELSWCRWLERRRMERWLPSLALFLPTWLVIRCVASPYTFLATRGGTLIFLFMVCLWSQAKAGQEIFQKRSLGSEKALYSSPSLLSAHTEWSPF